MKKILMLVMMVVTMGLVGCGAMSAEEVEKEIVSIAEENGYEMIIIKKNDSEVEMPVEEEPAVFSIEEEELIATPTPFPSPTPVIEKESEVTDEVIDYKIDPKTGEKIPVYATPTPEITEETKAPTVKIYGEIHAQENHLTPGVFSMYFTFYFADNDTTYRTQSIPLTLEEYNIASVCQSALVEVYADENGEAARPWNSILYMEWLSYEFVTEQNKNKPVVQMRATGFSFVLAVRARLLRTEFLSRGKLHKFSRDFLCNLPIVFYPEMQYT